MEKLTDKEQNQVLDLFTGEMKDHINANEYAKRAAKALESAFGMGLTRDQEDTVLRLVSTARRLQNNCQRLCRAQDKGQTGRATLRMRGNTIEAEIVYLVRKLGIKGLHFTVRRDPLGSVLVLGNYEQMALQEGFIVGEVRKLDPVIEPVAEEKAPKKARKLAAKA